MNITVYRIMEENGCTVGAEQRHRSGEITYYSKEISTAYGFDSIVFGPRMSVVTAPDGTVISVTGSKKTPLQGEGDGGTSGDSPNNSDQDNNPKGDTYAR